MAGNGHHNTSVINKLSQGKWVLETAAKPHCNTFKRLPNSSRLCMFFLPAQDHWVIVFVCFCWVNSRDFPCFSMNLPMFFHSSGSRRLMLTYDPNTRPSAGDLLTHKWLTASATAPVGRVAKAHGARGATMWALAVEICWECFYRVILFKIRLW